MLKNLSGIVLRTYPINDTDIVTILYTKEIGKISAIAKAVRRNKGRLQNLCQPFVFATIYLNVSNSGLSLIHQAEVEEGFGIIRTNIEKMACGSYFLEIVNRLTPEQQHDSKLFDTVLSYLFALSVSTTAQLRGVQAVYLLRLLQVLGHAPMLSNCCVCGALLKQEQDVLKISIKNGGAICGNCEDEETLALNGSETQSLLQLNTYDIGKHGLYQVGVEDKILTIIDSFVFNVLEGMPKSYQIYKMFLASY